MSNIIRRHLIALSFVLGGLPASAIAQAYPDKPITVLSTFGPGSPQDAVVRALCDAVSKDLKQPIIVDLKMGAGGAISATAMLAQKADGYTLGMNVTPALSTLPLMQKLSYDPARDFTYIIQLASFPLGIVAKAESPFKSWADLVQHAKANPGKVTYGTPGVGSLVNLGMLRLQAAAGIALTHVPHQNPMEIIPAVLGDHVQLMASGTEWKANAEAGKMASTHRQHGCCTTRSSGRSTARPSIRCSRSSTCCRPTRPAMTFKTAWPVSVRISSR